MPRSAQHRALRALLEPGWRAENRACGLCGQATIDWDGEPNEPESFEMDHILPKATHPELEFDPANQQPSHHRCNRSKGAGSGPADIGITSETW